MGYRVNFRITGINKRGVSYIAFILADHTSTADGIKSLYKHKHPNGWRKLPKHQMVVERMYPLEEAVLI